MTASINSKAVQVPAMVRESDGKTLIWTSGGYRTPEEVGVVIDNSDAGSAAGGLTVEQLRAEPLETTISTLFAGEDPDNNVQNVLHIGTDFSPVGPIVTPAGPMPNSSVVLGQAVGDGYLLERISCVVRDPTRAAVYLEHGNAPDVLGGVGGTAPAAVTTTIALATPFGLTEAVAAWQFFDHLLWVAYIPEVGGVSAGREVKIMRRIVGNTQAAVGTTAITFTVAGELMKGATITGWGIRPANAAWEIFPPVVSGSSHDQRTLHWLATDPNGFRLSVDSGLMIFPSGDF